MSLLLHLPCVAILISWNLMMWNHHDRSISLDLSRFLTLGEVVFLFCLFTFYIFMPQLYHLWIESLRYFYFRLGLSLFWRKTWTGFFFFFLLWFQNLAGCEDFFYYVCERPNKKVIPEFFVCVCCFLFCYTSDQINPEKCKRLRLNWLIPLWTYTPWFHKSKTVF